MPSDQIKELSTLGCPEPLPQIVPRPQGLLAEPEQVQIGRVPGTVQTQAPPTSQQHRPNSTPAPRNCEAPTKCFLGSHGHQPI